MEGLRLISGVQGLFVCLLVFANKTFLDKSPGEIPVCRTKKRRPILVASRFACVWEGGEVLQDS